MGFVDLEKMFDGINRVAIKQVLRIHDVGGKLLNIIKSMYANTLACIRVKECESECFRIESGVRQGYIMST